MINIKICICCSVAQSRSTLCDPMNCSPPGSSVHRILQAKVLEWVDISFSRRSFQPRDQTHISCLVRFFTTEPPEKPKNTGVDEDLQTLPMRLTLRGQKCFSAFRTRSKHYSHRASEYTHFWKKRETRQEKDTLPSFLPGV